MRSALATLILVVSLAAFSTKSVADGYLNVAPVGVLNFSKPKVETAGVPVDTSSKLGLGLGALAYFPLFPFFSLESGLLFLSHKAASGTIETKYTNFQVPIVLRFHPIPFVSIGAGPYIGFAVGDVAIYDTVTATTADRTYDALGLSKTDVGLIFSGALELTVAPLTALLVDFRYLVGLKNLSSVPGNTTKLGGFQVLAGLKFGF